MASLAAWVSGAAAQMVRAMMGRKRVLRGMEFPGRGLWGEYFHTHDLGVRVAVFVKTARPKRGLHFWQIYVNGAVAGEHGATHVARHACVIGFDDYAKHFSAFGVLGTGNFARDSRDAISLGMDRQQRGCNVLINSGGAAIATGSPGKLTASATGAILDGIVDRCIAPALKPSIIRVATGQMRVVGDADARFASAVALIEILHIGVH
jgi:hypothetical protein